MHEWTSNKSERRGKRAGPHAPDAPNRHPLATLALLVMVLTSACSQGQPETAVDPDAPLFQGPADGCSQAPAKVIPRAALDAFKITENGQWVAFMWSMDDQHVIFLDDQINQKRIKISHPRTEVALTDISFSPDGKRLSFIGSPWGLFGISEIFTIDLDDLTIHTYGERGVSYRRPISVSDEGAMLFFVNRGLRKEPVSLNKLAGREYIRRWLAFYDGYETVTYLTRNAAEDSPVNSWSFSTPDLRSRDSIRMLQDFIHPPGILYDGDTDHFYAFDSDALFNVVNLPASYKSFEDFFGYEIAINDGAATVLGAAPHSLKSVLLRLMHLTRDEAQDLFEDRFDADWSIQSICLDQAMIQ